eukprot:gene9377-12635_t
MKAIKLYVAPVRHFFCVHYRSFSSNDNKNGEQDDENVIATYENNNKLIPQIKKILKYWSNPVDPKLIGIDPNGTFIEKFLLNDHLQHPLLEKYKFDPVDFIVGANAAFQIVYESYNSKDFIDFAKDQSSIKMPAAAEILNEVLHPSIYAEMLHATKYYVEKQKSDYVLENIKCNTFLYNIRIALITEEMETTRLKYEPKLLKTVKDFQNAYEFMATILKNQNLSADLETIELYQLFMKHDIAYPIGSVVARIKVRYQLHENNSMKDLFPCMTRSTFNLDAVNQMTNIWTYEGCISGHTELNWKIIGV